MDDALARLIDRLENWKFEQAQHAAQEIAALTANQKEIIDALAASFGNCGWLSGHLGTILEVAVTSLVEELKQHDRREADV